MFTDIAELFDEAISLRDRIKELAKDETCNYWEEPILSLERELKDKLHRMVYQAMDRGRPREERW